MRVYCSGAMTGYPDLNRPAFDAAAKRLREQGHFVINPAELSAMFGTAEEIAKAFQSHYYEESRHPFAEAIYESTMSADLAAVRSCDAIYLLRGWETSRGAKKELAEALAHGLQVMQEGEK